MLFLDGPPAALMLSIPGTSVSSRRAKDSARRSGVSLCSRRPNKDGESLGDDPSFALSRSPAGPGSLAGWPRWPRPSAGPDSFWGVGDRHETPEIGGPPIWEFRSLFAW